jgi:hypothetical protein
MNIFALSDCPVESAQLQCDKHVGGKMATESAQMLSTSHRMIDGIALPRLTKSGLPSKRMYYTHPVLDDILYKSVHENHPCTIWTNTTDSNYIWHYKHFMALCKEYTYRYGKIHACETKFREVLSSPPKNIPKGPLTKHLLAMKINPECMFPEDPVKSYRLFYQTKQERFKMTWSKRPIPEWFKVKETT